MTFIPEGEAAAFGGGASDSASVGAIHLQHAGWKTEVLRLSLLPSLLGVRRTNLYAGIADAHVFETASAFVQEGDAAVQGPTERRMLAAVAGDVGALTRALRLLADRLGPAVKVWVEPADYAFFVRGAAGRAMMQIAAGEKKAIGTVGLVTPELQ